MVRIRRSRNPFDVHIPSRGVLIPHLFMIKRCTKKDTQAVRVSRDLEKEVKRIALTLGVSPYVLRNVALAIGLDSILATMPDSEILLHRVEQSLRGSVLSSGLPHG